MKNNVLLIGNGVNNINNNESWENLLKSIKEKFKFSNNIEINTEKHFPLLYEEIYLNSINSSELSLREFIADEVKKINENEIHKLIRDKGFEDIITTNYDYTLQGIDSSKIKNSGEVREKKFNIFRNNEVNGTRIWHIHGECNVPESITLGYAHYCGQIQQMRNYVVSGTSYKNKLNQKPLCSRIGINEVFHESWIDIFFTKNIHIIGLSLDFVETDLWWLLTYRARLLKRKVALFSNKIIYYIQEKYINESKHKHKIEMLKAVNIEINIRKSENEKYYKEIIDVVK